MKTRVVIVSCLVSAGVASAQPKAPAKAPAKPAPCLPMMGSEGPPRFVIAAGSATVCVDHNEEKPKETCFAYSPTAAPKQVPPPPVQAAKPVAEVKQDAGKWSVCVSGACKPVGKKLAKALAAAAKSDAESNITTPTARATDDGKAVAFNSELWVVAGDKKLKPKAPKDYKGEIDKPSLVGTEVAGNAMIAHWANCAGPCTLSILVDAKGTNRGKTFGGGIAVPLDAKRLAVLSVENTNELVVIDLATAKQTSKVGIEMGGVTPAGAAKVDDGTVAYAFQGAEGWTVGYVATPADKPATKGATYQIAGCPM